MWEIFKKAVKKFPSSETIWSAYIQYASTQSGVSKAVSVFHSARKSVKQVSETVLKLVAVVVSRC